jgi:hypothetical protein
MPDNPLTRIWRGIDDRTNRLLGNDVLRRAEAAVTSHEDDEKRIARVRAEWTQLKAEFEGRSDDEAEAEFSRRVDELDAELAELESDIADEADIGTLLDDLRVVAKRRQRITERAAQAVFLLQLAAIAAIILFPNESTKTASAVHIEYYSAVATIAPVLLVAGFVEVVVIGLPYTVWYVLTFGVGPVVAIVASLNVLATHKSTPVTDKLSSWGLLASLALFVGFVALHATLSRRESGSAGSARTGR